MLGEYFDWMGIFETLQRGMFLPNFLSRTKNWLFRESGYVEKFPID
jgi:hypothetical protein